MALRAVGGNAGNHAVRDWLAYAARAYFVAHNFVNEKHFIIDAPFGFER